MNKTISTYKILKERLVSGIYQDKDFPSERFITQELNISRTTLRNAIKKLSDEKLLKKLKNGKFISNSNFSNNPVIAFLRPMATSTAFDQLLFPLNKAAYKMGMSVNIVYYLNEIDPQIKQTLENYEAIFFVPLNTYIKPDLLTLFQKFNDKVFVYDHDLSYHNIFSLIPYPPQHIPQLLSLFSKEVKTVDCFSVTPEDIGPIFKERIGQWQLWLDVKKNGKLHHIKYKENSNFDELVIDKVTKIIKSKKLPDAIFFTAELPAIIAIRIFANHGFYVGKDIKIVAISDTRLCRYMNPQLTALEINDPYPLIVSCLKYLTNKTTIIPKALIASKPQLYIGKTH